MRVAAVLVGTLAGATAQAVPLEVSCHQRITQTSYTGSGVPLPTQHIIGTVEYTIDFDRRALVLHGNGKDVTFLDGRGQHVIVDHDGMTLAGTTQLGVNGPVTSEITHFNAYGTYATSERKLLMHGRLMQKADTVMRCKRTTFS